MLKKFAAYFTSSTAPPTRSEATTESQHNRDVNTDDAHTNTTETQHNDDVNPKDAHSDTTRQQQDEPTSIIPPLTAPSAGPNYQAPPLPPDIAAAISGLRVKRRSRAFKRHTANEKHKYMNSARRLKLRLAEQTRAIDARVEQRDRRIAEIAQARARHREIAREEEAHEAAAKAAIEAAPPPTRRIIEIDEFGPIMEGRGNSPPWSKKKWEAALAEMAYDLERKAEAALLEDPEAQERFLRLQKEEEEDLAPFKQIWAWTREIVEEEDRWAKERRRRLRKRKREHDEYDEYDDYEDEE